MKKIPLTQGFFALVDDEDFERVNIYKWTLQKGKRNYAYRFDYSNRKRTKVFLHRFIMRTLPEMSVDHIDGDGLNNQKANMRNCNQQQNCFNQRPRQNCSSKYKGVSWDKNTQKWSSYIHFNREKKNLGSFDSDIAAARAYDRAAMSVFGEFAQLNAV
jgi:hypothetical protein